MLTIHYRPPWVTYRYAPCGAAFKERTKRRQYTNYTDHVHSANCGNCKRTAHYRRGQILALPSVTRVKIEPRFDYRYLLGEDGHYHDARLGPFFPEPGSTWGYGEWDNDPAPEDATHIMIDYTGYSDYSGSSVERSNSRSLLRDYPDTFTDAQGGHGTTELMLAVDWSPPDDGRAGLLGNLAALADYPLYDEEDHSALEMECADEAWSDYLADDFRRDLISQAESPEAMEDALDALEELSGQHDPGEYPNTTCKCGLQFRNWDSILAHTDQFPDLSRMFWDSVSNWSGSPYMESATDVVFPEYDDSLAQVAERIWRMRCDALTAPARGQDVLPLEVTSS